jgi:hypothetical protein
MSPNSTVQNVRCQYADREKDKEIQKPKNERTFQRIKKIESQLIIVALQRFHYPFHIFPRKFPIAVLEGIHNTRKIYVHPKDRKLKHGKCDKQIHE